MILIDMNMPRSCQGCPAFATEACDKWYKHKTFSDQRTKRHKDCPLHENDVIEVLQEIRDEMFKVSVIDMLDDLKSPQVMKLEFLEIINKYIAQYKEEEE